jgi:hypothetical protein
MNDQVVMDHFAFLLAMTTVQFLALLAILFFGYALAYTLRIYDRVARWIAPVGQREKCKENLELIFLGAVVWTVLFTTDAVLISCFC